MAEREYKLDLQDTEFAMLPEQQTRTTLISPKGAGEIVNREDRPAVSYCYNVMPTNYGYKSVGYISAIDAGPALGAGVFFIDVQLVHPNGELPRAYLGFTTNGDAYTFYPDETAGEWQAVIEHGTWPKGVGFDINKITYATVNGLTYIYYSGVGAYKLSSGLLGADDTIDSVTLTGITLSITLGVVASSGYLMVYSLDSIAWSSTIDPTDFVPSAVTGAGGASIAELEGHIVFCTNNRLGILIYSVSNTIAGTYTGNSKYPFKFRPVSDSKGGITLDQMAYEVNSENQFVYTTGGLQSVSSTKAQTILPQVTDFLAGSRLQEYDEATDEFITTELTTTMLKKVKYIASRYLVISYGEESTATAFTHCLVFDTALSKLGKLKIDHRDVFEYTSAQTEVAKMSIGFLLGDGEVKYLTTSPAPGLGATAIFMLGKMQYSSNRLIQLSAIELENVTPSTVTAPLEMYVKASLDGKNTTNVEPRSLAIEEGELAKYTFYTTAKNFSTIFKGVFDLTTALITYVVKGRR
jgi:hypothetical protein